MLVTISGALQNFEYTLITLHQSENTMTAIDFYQDVLQQHAIAPATFAGLVHAFFRDIPENIGPCIQNTASLSKMLNGLAGREQVGIYISDQDTNTDLRFNPEPGTSVHYYPRALFRGICTIFQQSVFQFYKAKKFTSSHGICTTVVFVVYSDGQPVYFGDLMDLSF